LTPARKPTLVETQVRHSHREELKHPIEPDTEKPVTASVTPTAATPERSWRRRHFCGVCPRELQSARGFDAAEFVEHTQAHAAASVRELVQDAHRYRAVLVDIDLALRNPAFQQWPADTIRRVVLDRVDIAIGRESERAP
jgi:hypothetical protein